MTWELIPIFHSTTATAAQSAYIMALPSPLG